MRSRSGEESGSYAWYVAGLTVAGAVLRLSTIGTRSFWLDEATTVRQASLTLPALIARMADNVHPPFFHILMHFWIRVFGTSEVAVRMFAAVWGIGAIPLAYWAGKMLYDRRAGLVTAGVVTFGQFFIWYSQEARMYTMMLVFALASTASMWRALRDNRFGWWAAYALSTAFGVMTQYFFSVLVLTQGVYFLGFCVSRLRTRVAAGGLRFRWARPWRLVRDVPQLIGYAGSLMVTAVPFLWWLPMVLSHPELFNAASGPANYGWAPPKLGIHFNELILVSVEAVLGFHAHLTMRDLVSMWPLLLTVAVLSVGYAKRATGVTAYLLVTGVGGVVVMALLGQWQPIVVSRYFTAVLVPVTLLAGHFLASLKPVAFKPVVAILLVASLAGWVDQSFNPNNEIKWDNREAMAIVRRGWEPGDVILLIPYFVSSIPEYYLTPEQYATVVRVPEFGANGRVRNSTKELDEDLTTEVGNATRVWVVATWQDTPRIVQDKRNTVKWLRDHGYELQSQDDLRQIEVSLYERPTGRFLLPEEQP